MRKSLRISALIAIALLLSWAQPGHMAQAKEAIPSAQQYLIGDRDKNSESASGGQSEKDSAINSESNSESQSESQPESRSRDGASSEESSLSSPKSEPPHTLLFYAIQAIATLLGVTILLALISSSGVIFLATIWHTMKLFNGGKKPEIG